jgi:hypothetical protein
MMRSAWLLPVALALSGTAASAGGAAIELDGKGVQIYGCEAVADGFVWRFKAPEAVLTDASGAEIGRHFAGPSWQAKDGSIVVGALLASSPAPQPAAIPWLVLQAKSHSGTGLFGSVGYILRSRTEGGVAPSSGCDASHVGAEIRVPYSAVYTLFPQP